MRIGFIKLGLKTYFEKSGSGEGSNHELVDVFQIFQARGHECFMLSNNDIDPDWGDGTVGLDWVFVFNGFAPSTWETNMNMLKGSLESMKWLRDHKEIPYAYFWTDPRYDISKNPIFKEIPPKVILSQEPEYYAHLDKLILFQKNPPLRFKKDIKFAILMNDTKETKRRKAVIDCTNWLRDANISFEVKGKWKDLYLTAKPLLEIDVMSYLACVEYSFNCGKKEDWVSQKYWEMALNGVICFYTNYDSKGLLMDMDDDRRVRDGIDVVSTINSLDNDPGQFHALQEYVRSQLRSDYFTGDFVYKIIMEKLNAKEKSKS